MDYFTKLANSMTSEQYLKLVAFAHGDIPEEIKKMSDDELYAELTR